MNRKDKTDLLTKVIQGTAPARRLQQLVSRLPVLLVVQKEPDNGYSIKPDATRPELPAGILTEPEYSKVLESLRKNYEPVICIIRPEKKARPNFEL